MHKTSPWDRMNTAVTRWGYQIGQALHYHAAFLPWDYIHISYHAWRGWNRLKLNTMDFLLSFTKHIRWNLPGRAKGRTVPSFQQLSIAAPFWCITAAKVYTFSGCNKPWQNQWVNAAIVHKLYSELDSISYTTEVQVWQIFGSYLYISARICKPLQENTQPLNVIDF
jgi:hypothetical protein